MDDSNQPDNLIIQRFKRAIEDDNPEAAASLLLSHPALAARIDEPWFAFDTPAIVNAAMRGSRGMVDVLLRFGAALNVRSGWWAGGFGVLHHEHYDLSRYLIERGADVDPHAAAALGMLDVLRKSVEEDPEAVNRRGPDGQVPLHFAGSREVIDFLLAHGADIDKRDIDHNSTPAQYAVDRPDKCSYLIERGARPDIFMACMLDDAGLVRAILNEDPNALQAQVGKGSFAGAGGHIYEYKIGAGTRPLFLADRLGRGSIAELMLSYSSTEQRLLLACMRADTETVRKMLTERADLVQSLQPEDRSVIAEAAGEHRADAVRLMLEVGFPADACRNDHKMTALHRAAAQGDDKIVRLLLAHGAAVDLLNGFGGTPLNSCIWGSLHIRDPEGDYAATAESLIAAGVKLPDRAIGSESVLHVLVRHGARIGPG